MSPFHTNLSDDLEDDLRWREIRAEENAIKKDQREKRKILKTKLSDRKFRELIKFCRDGKESWYIEGIVGQKDVYGKRQEEKECWFKYIYLQQTTGIIEDDFYGVFFIPINDKEFLKVSYSC
jgi:hypothetical protein